MKVTDLQLAPELHVPFHEAAHATVAIRSALPLESVDVRKELKQKVGPGGERKPGRTQLNEEIYHGWYRAFPDPFAKSRLEAAAVMGAAGLVAEVELGRSPDHSRGWGDQKQIYRIAAFMKPFRSEEDPAFQRFMVQAYCRAGKILFQDEMRGWLEVTTCLALERYLTGDQVASILKGGGNNGTP